MPGVHVHQEEIAAFETRVDDPSVDGNAAVAWIRSQHPSEGRYLLCGPPGFVYAVADALLQAGVARENLASDVFDYAPRAEG